MKQNKLLIHLINSLLLLLLLIICVYVFYKYYTFKETFDSEVTKISGTATFLNNSIPSSIPEDSDIINEKPSEVVSSPAEIARVNKIIADTVPKSAQPQNISLSGPASMPTNIYASSPGPSPIELVTNPNTNPHALTQSFPKLNSTSVPPQPSELSPKEKQLFDAFLEERISDDKIVELIESGVLTEATVEKFLKMVDDLPEGPPVSRAPKKKLSHQAIIKNKDDNLLEGFTGNTYAHANGY